jgi:hypothetical protein
MRRTLGAIVAVVAVWACGGATFTSVDGGGGDGGSSSSSGSSGSSSGSSGSSGSGSGSSSGSSGSSGSSSGASSGSSGSSSGGVQRVPVNHRPSDAQCFTTPPAGTCNTQGGTPGNCSKDANCMADGGTNGRCVETGGGVLYCSCTYDTCSGDSACPTGETCACHQSPYTNNQGNTCVQGNCRVDSDCGTNGYCSPADNTMSCGSLLGYYCHTSADQCIDDSDCSSMSGFQVCTYVATSSRWECKTQGLCG